MFIVADRRGNTSFRFCVILLSHRMHYSIVIVRVMVFEWNKTFDFILETLKLKLSSISANYSSR